MSERHAAEIAARMRRIPTTWHTWIIVLLASGSLVVEALDIGSLGIILPIIRKTMALTPSEVGMLAASSALGIVIGMIPAGGLADRFGRKNLLLGGTIWFAGMTILAAFSPNFAVLLALRALSGLGMAPAFIMPYAIVSEFVSATSRAAFAGVLESSLGIGYLLPPFLGLLIVPNFEPEMAWRVFLLVAGAPIVYVWVIWKWLPESPRWLSQVGRVAEADAVVSSFERRVEKTLGRRLPAPNIAPETAVAVATVPPVTRLRTMLIVWTPPYLMRTVAMTIGAAGVFSMFYLGVNYIPSILVERNETLNNAFLFTIIISASQIPGKILNGICAEYVGRKGVYLGFSSVAIVSSFMFGSATTTFALVAWGMLLLFSASGTSPSFKMWYAELYPTRIRTTGQATVESIGGRLVGGVIWTFLFPVLIAATGLRTTMAIAGLLGILGIIVVMAFVPETRGRTVEFLEGAVAETAEPLPDGAESPARHVT
jgi:MFS transporter, putative metabolite:H+ symporter